MTVHRRLSGMPLFDHSRLEGTAFALVAIGIFKLLKASLLLVLGIGLVHWRDQDLGQVAGNWIDTLWVGRPFFDSLVLKLSSLHQRTLDEVAVGSFVYSGLLLVEGVGLCCRKRWAEFLTVAITASLLPFEFFELFRRLTATGAFITLLNIAIVWYLVIQLIHGTKDRRTRARDLPAT